jgi:diphosphomevalonate decarboxylase
MKRHEIVQKILKPNMGHGFAPVNIALCKYWGKRDTELNLPATNSLSISLGDKGAYTRIKENAHDEFIINGKIINEATDFYKKLKKFLDLFRPEKQVGYQIISQLLLV